MDNSVKNIIFDLGGVLLQINANASIEAFREMGMPDMIRPGGWGYNHPVFLEMEAGKLDSASFREGIRELLPQPHSDDEIDRAWCAMIRDYFPERIELVKQLARQYRVYLFSNTNAIHIQFFQQLYRDTFGAELSDLFVNDYYSSEIGLRKPAPEAFDFVLKDAGLEASETLFIDDSDANIDSAKKTGMKTIWLTPDSDLLSFF